MSENKKKILEMLEAGKVSAEEAMQLLSAVEDSEETHYATDAEVISGVKSSALKKIKYLRVLIDSPGKAVGDKTEKVNVRVPVALIRAGMKFTSLIPNDAAGQVEKALHDKGVNFNLKNIKDEDIEDLIEALRELDVDIDGGDGKVRVYAE